MAKHTHTALGAAAGYALAPNDSERMKYALGGAAAGWALGGGL